MKKLKLNQNGSHVLASVLVIVVVIVIGAVGWMVFGKSKDKSQNSSDNSGFVEWSFDGSTWSPQGEAPECEQPLAIASPMDVSQATSVLYPGQVRGGDFKAHGGIGIDDADNNELTVKAIRGAHLYQGSRYIEQGAVQYMFDFMDSCGIMYRYDHLATLSPEFQAFADQLPEPQVDDSRTTKFNEQPFIKEGTVIATAVGYSQPTVNAFFDLGVYDLRQPNAASQTEIYKTDQGRIQDKQQSFFAVCWFDLLPEPDRTTVKSLPPRGSENTSDYCQV